jgi:acetyl esterase/lipase
MRPQNRFLLTTAVGAAATANALRPVQRTGPLSVPAFASGLPTSELPLQTLALQAALALVAARGGGRKGLRGAAGLALTAASAVGLTRLHREALEADEVLEQALCDELGNDYRSRINEPFVPAPDAPLTRKSILLPDFLVRRRYRVEKDIPYGEAGRRNRMDIWRRQDLDRDAKAPVLVQIHGGAWMMGQKEGQGEPLMSHLVQRGWVCVAPNYRLSPRSTWPDHIVDVKKVLAWVKDNIAEHGGDPEFVVITGGSAGGHLCSLAALTPGLADFQPGFEDADTSVAACVAFYGVYDFTNRHGTGREDMLPFLEKRVFKSLVADDRPRWEQASTISHVNPDAPPFFVLHGTNDSLVPVEQARSFVEDLRKASSAPVAYAELPMAQHAFDILPSIRAAYSSRAVERFLAVVRSEFGGPTPAEAVGSSG